MNEVAAVNEWLYTRLNGDTTLAGLVTGVYRDRAPDEAAFPFVVFALEYGRDHETLNAVRIWTEMNYAVKIVTDARSLATIAPAADRIDALLHRASGAATGITIHEVRRTDILCYAETLATREYLHLGGMYQIRAS